MYVKIYTSFLWQSKEFWTTTVNVDAFELSIMEWAQLPSPPKLWSHDSIGCLDPGIKAEGHLTIRIRIRFFVGKAKEIDQKQRKTRKNQRSKIKVQLWICWIISFLNYHLSRVSARNETLKVFIDNSCTNRAITRYFFDRSNQDNLAV